MKNKDCDLPVVIKVIGAGITSFIFLCFIGKVIGYEDLNYFFVDHGSLIAGVMAVAGVALMVHTQKLETAKVIKSNENVMKNEAFEIKRSKAIDGCLKIRSILEDIQEDYHHGTTIPQFIATDLYVEVRALLLYVDYFLKSTDESTQYLDAIKKYCKYQTEDEDRKRKRFYGVLLAFSSLESIEGYDDSSFFCTMDDSTFVMLPKELLDSYEGYNSFDISRYMTDYMRKIVLENLSRFIENQALD